MIYVGRGMDMAKLKGASVTMQMCQTANLMIRVSPYCLSVYSLWPFINILNSYHKTWHKHYATGYQPNFVCFNSLKLVVLICRVDTLICEVGADTLCWVLK
jgi:hypothetical protein